MMHLLENVFTVLCVILIIVINIELKISNDEYNKYAYEADKKDNINRMNSNNNCNNILSDYIKNTNDLSILKNNTDNDLNSDTSFVNPNLSIKNARSSFNVPPINLDPNSSIKNKEMVDKFEKNMIKKIK